MKSLAILTTFSIVVTAVYVLRGLARVFQGPITNPEFEKLTDADLSEKLCTGILIAVIVIVGLLPFFFIDLIEGSLWPLINRISVIGSI